MQMNFSDVDPLRSSLSLGYCFQSCVTLKWSTRLPYISSNLFICIVDVLLYSGQIFLQANCFGKLLNRQVVFCLKIKNKKKSHGKKERKKKRKKEKKHF